MKRLFVLSLLAICSIYGARSRGPVKPEWNSNDVCLEQDFGTITSVGAWFVSPWLHAYFQTPDWWVYHCDKGWLYPESDGNEGVWFYWERLEGWVWTRGDIYPFAYTTVDNKWFNFCVKPE